KDRDGQFAFLLVEFQKQPVQPAVEVPIQITEVVAGDIIAVIGKFDRLPARLAAPFALERTFGAALGEQLELLEAAEQFGGEQVGHRIKRAGVTRVMIRRRGATQERRPAGDDLSKANGVAATPCHDGSPKASNVNSRG